MGESLKNNLLRSAIIAKLMVLTLKDEFFLRVLILVLDQIQFNFIFYLNAFSSESISRSFLLGRDFKQNLFLIKKLVFFPSYALVHRNIKSAESHLFH